MISPEDLRRTVLSDGGRTGNPPFHVDWGDNDDDTGQHILRVGRYVAIIAQSMGMTPTYVDMIEQAAQLHDVGKIGIPDSILQKPGKLADHERYEMQLHSGYGKKFCSL